MPAAPGLTAAWLPNVRSEELLPTVIGDEELEEEPEGCGQVRCDSGDWDTRVGSVLADSEDTAIAQANAAAPTDTRHEYTIVRSGNVLIDVEV